MLDDDRADDRIELNDLFPNLKPVRRPPTVGTWNGVGLVLYGKRDVHPETGTFLKTRWFTILFLPILALGSYRCGERHRRLFCLGKEPLGGLAKVWNLLVVGALAAGIGMWQYQAYIDSPSYRGRVAMEELQEAATGDDRIAVLQQADRVARSFPQHRDEAVAIAGPLVEALLAESDLDRLAAELPAGLALADSPVVAPSRSEMIGRVVPTLTAAAPAQAGRAHACLAAWAPPPPPYSDAVDPWAEPRLTLLQRAYDHAPEDVGLAVAWALHCETQDDLDASRAALWPVREQLGQSEGARLLGQILAGEGAYEEAHALLWSYAGDRLVAYQDLSKRWERELETAYERHFQRLQNGDAGNAWYTRYNAADGERQDALVQEWLGEQVMQDPRVTSLRDELERSSAIVGVAFDLGIVSLHRAQTLSGEARQQGFQQAEDAFLAIQGSMGEETGYQLYLAQVYMWMGREAEAQELFDRILASDRSPTNLALIGHVKRELGDDTAARALFEEAYEASTDPEEQKQMAGQRALVFTDLDDEIHWLKLSKEDADDPGLAWALGKQAYEQGDDAAARQHFQTAVDGYAKQPPTSSSLNNGSLAGQFLFMLTGDLADFRRAAELQRRALRLEPNHSIVLQNTASVLQELAVLEVVGERLDYGALRATPALDDLAFFYDDAAGRDALMTQLAGNSHFKEARDILRRLQVLAPRNAGPFLALFALESTVRDETGLAGLGERAAVSDFDLATSRAEAMVGWFAEDFSEDVQYQQARLDRFAATATAELAAAPASRAFHRHRILTAQLALHDLGVAQDLAALLAAARQLRQEWPCEATASLVRSIGWERCLARLQQDGLVPEDVARIEPQLTAATTVCLVVTADDQTASRFAATEECQGIVAALARRGERYPQAGSPHRWALASAIGADDAERCRQACRSDPVWRTSIKVLASTARYRLGTALSRYLAARVDADHERARTVVAEAREWGMPLPACMH